jgi:RNA polymerase sigma-70 factor (ECF subfamily)
VTHDDLVVHIPAMRREARRYLQGPDADDAVQDSLIKALQHPHDPARGSLRPWLCTIVKHECFTLFRKSRPVIPPAELAQPNPINTWIACQDVATPLAQLAPHYRSVLMMVLGGASYQEIACELAIPVGTVMSRLHRARRDMAQLLAQ